MKNKLKNIANMPKYGYICRALSKISKLALVGYNSLAHIVRSGLFLCVISLCVRMLWRSWRGTSSDVLATIYASLLTLFSFATII